ncbi:MAG: transcriptional regulator [Chloroflexota bacterium]|nr:transcriptional regulator [Chloroflexota bacterium]
MLSIPLPNPVLTSLPESRRLILEHVKRQGEADAEAIAGHLGITVSGARQQLIALERDGLLRHQTARLGPGRPKHLYTLTAAGDALFPRAYAELTNELLEYVEDEDPALLERIFDRRGQRRLQRARARAAGLPLPEQVQVVAQILDEDGYLADFERRPDGAFVITEHNCAVLSVAQKYRHACSSELAFLQEALPSAAVTRIAHRLNGGHVCAYLIVPHADAGSGEF